MRYELTIGLRYLRAKRKEAFISLITVISVVGVMIGVMTLNIVLAVMTGFEEDLRDRILGFNPHVVVTSYAGTIKNGDAVVEKIRSLPGVAAAAPLVYSQVMLSTGRNVSGVVVRGVPPEADEAVVDLRNHLKSGSLAGLGAPFEVPVDEDTDAHPDAAAAASDDAATADTVRGNASAAERPRDGGGRDSGRTADEGGRDPARGGARAHRRSGRSCGNRMTSRIEGELVSSITRRSMPTPSPAVGGRPYSSARM